MWKDFFYFTQREKQGILILTVLIAGIFSGKFFFSSKPSKAIVPEFQVRTEVSGSQTTDSRSSPNTEERTYYQEDPSRKKSYQQRRKEVPEKRTYYQQPRDTVRKTYVPTEKYNPGTIVQINRIDTTELTRIPGIGKSYATRILNYRQLLGGYYSVEQLKEVYGMYEELYEKIHPFFSISADSLRRIPVNQSSVERLKSHPYINFYQAKAIVELRKKKGKLKDLSELSLLEEFSAYDLERIKYYLSFD